MVSRRADGKIYTSIYLGKNEEGQKIAGTLKAKAQKLGLSLSEFLLKAGLEHGKAGTQTRIAGTRPPLAGTQPQNTAADTFLDEHLPPSLRPPVPTPRPPAARAPRWSPPPDSLEPIPLPVITGPMPDPKPAGADFE